MRGSAVAARRLALVNVTALEVARLTEELRLALRRLEDAQLEARIASGCVAAQQAMTAIANARQRAS